MYIDDAREREIESYKRYSKSNLESERNKLNTKRTSKGLRGRNMMKAEYLKDKKEEAII